MEWSKERTLELLNEIKARPCLWDVSCKEYRDRNKKADGFKEVADVFLCGREDIEKKLASLRSQYSRELQKIQKSRKSGSGAEDVYNSKWFAFKEMAFLRGGNVPNLTRTNLPAEDDSQGTGLLEEFSSTGSPECDASWTEIEEVVIESEPSQTTSLVTSPSAPTRRRQGAKRKAEDDLMSTALQFMKEAKERRAASSTKDACDVFGELVAMQLREVDDLVARESIKYNIQNLFLQYQLQASNSSGFVLPE